MSKVIRVFVEKKSGFDVEAGHMLSDLRDNLGIKGLTGLRLANRYDVEGLSAEDFDHARGIVFSEPNADNVYDEVWNLPEAFRVFQVEYLPGQYDQRADSAAQCVQLLTGREKPRVLTARVIALSGDITDGEFEAVKKYIINPVEARVASAEKPESLEMDSAVPNDIERIAGFIGWQDGKIAEYHQNMGFAMSKDDLAFCQKYFCDTERRDPSLTELKVIDTYWSDHCRHTTFLTKLDNVEIEKSELSFVLEEALSAYYDARTEVYGDRQKDVTLMDMATMGMRLLKKRGLIPDLDISEEINACSIEVPVTIDGKVEQWLVQFKNETHNHPTEIEPFGGAATCLGGAIRDPLSGRAYVYQAMRVTGSGDPTVPFEETIDKKLSQRKITAGAAHGYSSYGNQIGLSTGQVVELYDKKYVAKRMEIGAVIGASPKSNVVRGEPKAGDIIVLLGGRTGRDGCGGATGSSKAHTDESLASCGAEVQKGNPPTERKIQRLFRNPEVSRLILRCNDFGAGGVCVAIGELARGLKIDLDKVPKKYEGLDGTELAISESQERMAVVLDKCDADAFLKAAHDENLEAIPVAEVTSEERLVMDWRGDTIVNLSREFLDTNGVTQHADALMSIPDKKDDFRTKIPSALRGLGIGEAFPANLSRLEVASQKGLSERFDSSIGAATVNMPFGGKYQLTPEETMTAKLPLIDGETDDATVMSYGFIPGHANVSPFYSAVYAVVESMSKICAAGADTSKARLTFQEYFERLRDDEKRWGKPASALLGAFIAQKGLSVPSIGGKDSMSGSFLELDVPPTLVSFAVAMTKASKTVSAAFQKAGSNVYYIEVPTDKNSLLPDWDKLKSVYTEVYKLVNEGKILSASVVKEGGVAACVAKMAFGNMLGFDFKVIDETLLYAPLSGGLVVEGEPGMGVLVGTANDHGSITIGGRNYQTDRLIDIWTGKLEPVFPLKASCPNPQFEIKLFTERSRKAPAVKVSKPKVLIPVFPGTNCEYDSARAFRKAGADTEILVVNNLTPEGIEQTVDRMVSLINESQIIMLPGGFSGGDEPDGSGKFIATTFRNPRISEAVSELLCKRDGLILGICNGFQALIKLGLVPYGEIRDIKPDDPTLTFNTIGRHQSRMVYTRVTSVKSPWMSLCEAGDVHAIPISHGEGRFVADESTMRTLNDNGQIATQYVDPDGKPSCDISFNPNGSVYAVEGIISPDGRVLGKMGHSERKGENLYKNVPMPKDQKIFESGVNYFKI